MKDYAYGTVNSVPTVALPSPYRNTVPLNIQGLLYRTDTDQKLCTETGGSGGRLKNKREKKNPKNQIPQ